MFDRLAEADLGELAGVFPALSALSAGAGYPITAAERFRAYHAVRRLIERLAAIYPVVLTLEICTGPTGRRLSSPRTCFATRPRAR